jgi:hypothetical protein
MKSPEISIFVSIFGDLDYYPKFFESYSKQTVVNKCELLIIHNDPTQKETKCITNLLKKYSFLKAKIIKLDHVESIYQSWNRAWLISDGKYITSWNIDDIRYPKSLEEQFNFLERNNDISICYGNFVENFVENNKFVRHNIPEFKKRLFTRKFFSGGAFLMWRNSIKNDIGYFDEQFLIAGDFEFFIRCCVAGLKMGKVGSNLGIFTNNSIGLSTNPKNEILNYERSLIQKRYGIFDKIKVKFQDEFFGIEKYIPNYENYLKARNFLWVPGFFKNILRRFLMLLRVWDFLIQKKERLNKHLIDL